ncbi:MAG: Gfo/Idh/MocA family oxidoreductase [Candidatus Brockarchaeota archaeon]|nr:Gfo/Idh/MocA family oxidoreductase [Candidatus Brockarchaeota archaeon]
MKKVRIGVVGCGGIANYFHLPELAKIEEAEIAAVADIKEDRAKATAAKFKVPKWYASYGKMLGEGGVDAVIVATPHPTHSPIAVDAIEAGKHVMIQKPMATNVEDADALVECARKHRKVKVMALPFVYFDNPTIKYVDNLVKGGKLGKVCMARVRVAHGGPEKYQEGVAKMFKERAGETWFFDRKKAGGGALFDMGVYSITIATLLLGRAKRVSSFMGTIDKKATVEDSAAIIMEMESGAIAVAETAWTQARGIDEFSLYGTEGVAFWDTSLGTPVVRHYRSSDSSWVTPQLPGEEPLRTHRHFVECILKNKQPIGTVEEGRYLVQVMEAARRSSILGKVVKLS